MRTHVAAPALLLAMLTGCSPVYRFRVASDSRPEAMRLDVRLREFLTRQGFQDLGFTDIATGDIGCGRAAQGRTTFENQWRGGDCFSASDRVWVHEFTCEGQWHVAIISSRGGNREAKRLSSSLSDEFAALIASGAMSVETRSRIALE